MSVDNFFPAGNEEVFAAFNGWLNGNTDKSVLFLHGVAGSGRSHLLQAACRFVSEKERPSIYVPAGEPGISGEFISQLDPESTVCIDDLDQVVGDEHWEEAVLEVHERLLSSNGRLLLAALQPPRVLGLTLPDLATRDRRRLPLGALPDALEDLRALDAHRRELVGGRFEAAHDPKAGHRVLDPDRRARVQIEPTRRPDTERIHAELN